MALTHQVRRIREGVEPGILSIDEALFISQDIFVQLAFEVGDAFGLLRRTAREAHERTSEGFGTPQLCQDATAGGDCL